MAETYDDLLEQYEAFLNDDVSFAAAVHLWWLAVMLLQDSANSGVNDTHSHSTLLLTALAASGSHCHDGR